MFKRLDIKSRLTTVIAMMSVLLIVIGGMGLLGMARTNEGLRSVYEDRTIPLNQLSDIQARLLANRLHIAVSLVTSTPAVIRKNTADVERNIGEISKIWGAYMATYLTPEEKVLADRFAADRKRFVEEGLKPTLAALRANNINLANRLVMDKIRPLYEPVGAGIRNLVQLQLDAARQEYAAAQSRYITIRNIAIGLIAAGIAMAVWLGLGLIRAIVRPLDAAIGHFDQIAQGNYSNIIDIERQDEIGKVMEALQSMQTKLGASIHALESNKHLAESALRIFASTSSVAGGEFFEALARSMVVEMGMRHVYVIGLPEGLGGAYQVLGALTTGAPPLPPVPEWAPLEQCLANGSNTMVFPRNIQALAPSDWLREACAEALGVSLLRDSSGSLIGFIAVVDAQPMEDEHRISTLLSLFSARAAMEIERIRFDSHLAHQATHDALTGLPNRVLLHDRLQQELLVAERSDRGVAVLFIDLDDFKDVNDCYGHDTGDQLLVNIAAALRETLRDEDTVARYGGDEFVVVIGRLESAADAELVAQKLIAAIAQPIRINEQQFHCKASIGIATCPEDGGDAQTLLRNADTALYRTKESHNLQYQFFTSGMNAELVRRVALEDQLRQALERNELALHYQPQVDLVSGRIIGIEALLRWQHPHRGAVPPGEFIPVAEACGLIVGIGDWVIERACRDLNTWRLQGHNDLRLAVNVSPRQFLDTAILGNIINHLDRYRIPHALFEIELTESLLIANPASTRELLHAFCEQGVLISMDDFGTGYSSLSYLKHYPIRRLKIDRSFVRDIADDPNAAALVQAIIAMAQALDVAVIAEGVETQVQCHRLLGWGCLEAQGFHLGRPVAAEAMGQLLAANGAAGRRNSTQQ